MGFRTPHSALRISSPLRRGFTLVELLVAITIFLILTSMTIVMVNNTFEAERLRSGTRQVQSYLEGARDRAIYAGEPRGVRLVYKGTPGGTNPNDYTVDSLVFVKPLDPVIDFLEIQPGGQLLTGPPFWRQLALAGVLNATCRIQISIGPTSDVNDHQDGTWYGIDPSSFDPMTGDLANPGQLQITRPHDEGGTGINYAYRLELLNGVLPNSEPVLMPRNIVVHLTAETNALPGGWDPPNREMDLMFSPRGTLVGAPESKGIIHLILCDLEDCPDPSADRVAQFFTTPNETNFNTIQGGLRFVSIFTRTGQVSSHQVDPNGGDPFEFSLTGEVTDE